MHADCVRDGPCIMCHATHRGATTRPLQIPAIACCSEHDTHWRLGSVAVPLERKPVCRRARRSACSHSGSVGVGHTQCVVVLAERSWALFESWRCNRRQCCSTCQGRCTCPYSHQNRSHGRSHSHLKSRGLFSTPNHARATVQLDALHAAAKCTTACEGQFLYQPYCTMSR
jgi:hypothetical protein